MQRRPFHVATGFTLIEMLIVVAIIGITVAMIRLGGGVLDQMTDTGNSNEFAHSVKRLAHSLSKASEQAMIKGRPISIEFLTGRYRFYSLDASGRWESIENERVFIETAVPDGWKWDLVQQDGQKIEAPYRLIFTNEPLRFSISLSGPKEGFLISGNSVGAIEWRVK